MAKRRLIQPRWRPLRTVRYPKKLRHYEADFIRYLCPRCGQRVEEPSLRLSGPNVRVHPCRGHDHGCRMVVFPDPEGGEHRVWVLPDDLSMERAIDVCEPIFQRFRERYPLPESLAPGG